MLKRSVLGVAALLASTSCVPPESAHGPAVRARQVVDATTLLHRLALDAPVAPLAQAAAVVDAPSATLAPAPAFTGAARSLDDAQRAVECLTAAVYYEARSEPEDGQRAVAQVVLNRVRDRAFPNSVCGVVYQGSTRTTGCQFSFTCDGSMRHPLEPGAWDRARRIAAAAYEGAVYAPVGSSTYYHATSVLPWWASSLTRVGQLGSHIFYRWRGLMEQALAFRQTYAGAEPERVFRSTADGLAAAEPATFAVATEQSVTVHRGRPDLARTTTMAGVRIHVGTAPGATALPVLSISDESDPTT